MPYLDLNGERIYYALHRNDPTGIPVLLIHGAGENHLIWPVGLRRLPGAVVYAVDLLGHGKSSGAGHDTIEAYAAWLATFGQALDLKPAIIVGHSMGGGIALAFALNYPGQTAGLALIASSAKLRVAPQLLDLAQNDFERAVDLVTQWEWGPLAPDAVKQLGKQQLLATNPTVMLNDYRACDAFDKRERLTEIYVPTLIIAGEVDAMTPFKHAQFMVERLPQARLVSVAQAGHMVMLEAETKVTLVMTQFVRDVLITATNNV